MSKKKYYQKVIKDIEVQVEDLYCSTLDLFDDLVEDKMTKSKEFAELKDRMLNVQFIVDEFYSLIERLESKTVEKQIRNDLDILDLHSEILHGRS